MLEPIECATPGIIAFDATGVISEADYRNVIYLAAEGMLKTHGELRILMRLGPGFSHYSRRAALLDAMMANEYGPHIRRFAVVSDFEGLKHLAKRVAETVGVDFGLFRLNQMDEALAWVAG
ncbi:MAG TPA: STAS/SEC14 domain-containing protein [Hyphomonas sp.]|nr:STAS/SEC14 domain-containing protein [Hyphomonas sp.]HRX73862.1 STAS/SEC14 domain-containing protein [Hyphomonas sp.]